MSLVRNQNMKSIKRSKSKKRSDLEVSNEVKKIPNHLGVIIDGNRRWAEERGLPAFEGHRKGFKKVKKLVEWCAKKGIKTLTVFVFSTENWKRSKIEVNYLMGLIKKAMTLDLNEISKHGIRIKVIGNRDRLPKSIQEAITGAERKTKNNKKMVLNFALSYGGREEIVEAVKNIIKSRAAVSQITEKLISKKLWTSDLDLIIRTGKEQRLSNFLIWQAAYSELYFFKKYWPDITKRDFKKALLDYAQRKRRFGQ